MKIKNPLYFADWDLKNFVIFAVSLQISILGLVGIDYIGVNVGFDLSIFRQIIGFLFLAFLPGSMLIRILRINKFRYYQSILYTIMLSQTYLMTVSFFMNLAPLNIFNFPLSTNSLIFTLVPLNFILLYFCYLTGNNADSSSNVHFISLGDILSPSFLFLSLIPFICIIGTHILLYKNSNVLLILLIIMIVFIIYFVMFTDFIPTHMYEFAVFVISISILYHTSLTSQNIYGFDIHQEYFFANLTSIVGHWSSDLLGEPSSMLSIVFLPNIYRSICGISLTSVFKIIYPFIFSLLPVGLYTIYCKQLKDKRISFLSVFYFISISVFYTEMLGLMKQEIAEVYFLLLLFLMQSEERNTQNAVLSITFAFSLIVSHYGLASLVILTFIGMFFLTNIIDKLTNVGHKSSYYNLGFVILCFIFAISWYMYFSNSTIFNSIINLFQAAYDVFFNPAFQESLGHSAVGGTILNNKSVSGGILRDLYFMSQFFIVVGFLVICANKYLRIKIKSFQETYNFSNEYISICFVFLGFLPLFLITTVTGINIHRMYHIVCIVLSPFCIIGGYYFFNTIISIFSSNLKSSVLKNSGDKSIHILTIFLILFFLFNVGFIQEFTDPLGINSLALSKNTYLEKNGEVGAIQYYKLITPTEDFFGITWLTTYRNEHISIYSDVTSRKLAFVSYGMTSDVKVLQKDTVIPESSYIYLRKLNVQYGVISEKGDTYWKLNEIVALHSSNNLLYNSGLNKIYLY